MKIWTCGSSPRSGFRNAWTRIKKVNGSSLLSNFWNLFGAIQMISCRDWWPWMKRGYIAMTQRQSNTQWSGGIVAHLAPKNSECKNPLESSRLDFLGSRRYRPHWLSSKKPNYQRGVLIISAGETEGHFEGKTPAEGHQGGLVLVRKCPFPPGTCNTEETSNIFIIHPILWIWPRRTTTWTEKNNWKVAIFRPTRRSLLPRRPVWTDKFMNFFEWLVKVRV